MNRTQKGIIASWVIIPITAVGIYLGTNFAVSCGALALLYVRGHLVEEKAVVALYFSNRLGMSLALMVSLITPFAWFAYRVFSTADLPESIGRELLGLSIPALVTMIIFDRWLYLRNKHDTIFHYNQDQPDTYDKKKQNKSEMATPRKPSD